MLFRIFDLNWFQLEQFFPLFIFKVKKYKKILA
jgi:hypothetical protein